MWHILLDHLIHFPLFDKNFRCFAIASSVTYPYSEIRQTILCQCTMWYATTLENPYQCSRFRFYIFIIYWGFFHRWKYCKYTLRLQDDTVTLNGRKPVLLLGYYWGDQGCRWRKCTVEKMLMTERVKEWHTVSTDSDTLSAASSGLVPLALSSTMKG